MICIFRFIMAARQLAGRRPLLHAPGVFNRKTALQSTNTPIDAYLTW